MLDFANLPDAHSGKPGLPVRVSDGTPEPPLRFTKKRADWRSRNYNGFAFKDDFYNPAQKILVGWSATHSPVLFVTPTSWVTARAEG